MVLHAYIHTYVCKYIHVRYKATMKLVSSEEKIFESTMFTRKNNSNIVQCFTSLIVTSLDIIQTSLFLAQKYEKVTFENILI